MPIELGLGRITRLLANAQPFPWRAVHVAGTNGKGSVCSHTANLLRGSGFAVGQFSTPHLLDHWDAISVHGLPIAKHRYDAIMAPLTELNAREAIHATEFELLTAAAFRAFSEYRLDVGVVEVGVGGRLDATNVLADPLATVITKIGLDHQALLGGTLEAIAREKAGIMKRGVPCLVDASNPRDLHDLFRAHAEDVGAGPITFVGPDEELEALHRRTDTTSRGPRVPHQRTNEALALAAARTVWERCGAAPDLLEAWRGLERAPRLPGRLARCRIASLTGPRRRRHVLSDGAHNPQAAAALGTFVDATRRRPGLPVTWLLAVTDAKDATSILRELLRPGDQVVAAEFGPVDGMPWVRPCPAERLLADAQATTRLALGAAPGPRGWLDTAVALAGPDGPLVVSGSLYLVADLQRDLRERVIDPSRALPPETTSWRVQRGERWFEVPRDLTGPAIARYLRHQTSGKGQELGSRAHRPKHGTQQESPAQDDQEVKTE